MSGKVWMGLLAGVAVVGVGTCAAQGGSQVQLKIEPANRTLTVSGDDRVSVEPEVAILHIGFETGLNDAKSAYAEGAKTSNLVVAALKQAGIPETSIRSEWQRLERDQTKPHKFKLAQQWTVKVEPKRAAEILDVAVTAGATESGDIEWTVNDVKALEGEALAKAAARARTQAEDLAKAMGVTLGKLVYVTSQASADFAVFGYANNSAQANGGMFMKARLAAPPVSIEPRKVVRTASVYAVYSIE